MAALPVQCFRRFTNTHIDMELRKGVARKIMNLFPAFGSFDLGLFTPEFTGANARLRLGGSGLHSLTRPSISCQIVNAAWRNRIEL